MPALFSDEMILQGNTTVTVWGQSLPLSNVQLYPSWSPVLVTTKSSSNGNWKIQCLTTKDHNTHTAIKSGEEKIDIRIF